MSPEDGVEGELAELPEPWLVEVVCGVVADVAGGVLELEGLGEYEALALCDASGEVCVGVGIAVDVVEALAVGVVRPAVSYADDQPP